MSGTDDSAKLAPASQGNAESSDSEDQFTDAQSAPRSPRPTSPKVNHPDGPTEEEPSSAVPQTNSAESRLSHHGEEPETSPGNARHGEHVEAEAQDVKTPDTIVGAASDERPNFEDDLTVNSVDSQTETPLGERTPDESRLGHEEATEDDEGAGTSAAVYQQDEDEQDAFGDDFDDFEEGGGGEDDFDDFEDGFQEAEPSQTVDLSPQHPTLPFPIPDFADCDSEDISAAMEPYLASLFPPEILEQVFQFPPPSKNSSAFTTPRSASLWSQLVAPPPLAPPDWIRSRTRRLFLVSLGVPVDLDEILPASKQKKLVLPSLNLPSGGSPRTSSDSRSVSRLRQGDANSSSASVDTQGKPRKRKGPPPEPELDMVASRHLCVTTDEALNGMTDEELKAHISKLEGLERTAKEVLEYWQKRTDEKIAERETFEGVIENLVKHARKFRK